MTNICNSFKYEGVHSLHIPKKNHLYVFLVFMNACWAVSGRWKFGFNLNYIFKKVSLNRLPGYGDWARENSSHKTIPKDQTSDCVENTPSLIDSSAIHLTGNGPWNDQIFLWYKLCLTDSESAEVFLVQMQQ